MNYRCSLSFCFSKAFLTSQGVLWILFVINFLGTVYGYQWYWSQMLATIQSHPLWQVIYVPDSPTASMFFVLVLIILLTDRKTSSLRSLKSPNWFMSIRSTIAAVAIASSAKYGIWAVGIIIAAGFKGDTLNLQDGMLLISHLGMAFEAVLFARFLKLSRLGLFIAALWLFSNDYIDYHYSLYPWLSNSLQPYIVIIRNMTIVLSLLTCGFFYVVFHKFHK